MAPLPKIELSKGAILMLEEAKRRPFMVDTKDLVDASPWHPMTDKVALKHLGKLGEELGECVAAVTRCIIQGIDECEPVTGKPNRQWLEDEIADCLAGFNLVLEHFGLDEVRITIRKGRKIEHLRQWHKMA